MNYIIEEDENDDLISLKVGALSVKPLIPNEYQQVDYIESSGGQWFNTNVSAIDGYKIMCLISFADGNNKNFSGAQKLSGGVYYRAFAPWAVSQSGDLFSLGIGLGGAVNTNKAYNVNQKYLIEANLNIDDPYLRVDGTNVVFTETPGGSISDRLPNTNIYLFAINNNGSPATGFVGKVYGNVKILVNDVLVRNFVPCYRKSDGVIGMYDTVNSVFYTNAGSGSFTKGNDCQNVVITYNAIKTYNE